jgi:hypothetical protein
MRPFSIWLRRGVGWRLGLLIAAFVFYQLFAEPDWRIELDWATRLTASSLLLVCPCVGAAAAYDTSRGLRPSLQLLSRGSTRRSAHIALPAAAVVAWSVLAYALVWAIAALTVLLVGGVGVTDWWVFPEVLAPVAAAGGVGLMAGMAVNGRLAAPIAAVAVLAGTMLASPWGRGPFEAVTTYGTLTGLERPVVRSAAAITGALVVAGCAAVAARALHRDNGSRRLVLTGCAAAAAFAIVLPAAWQGQGQVYVATSERYGCTGTAPSVCAPRSRVQLMLPVQASLAEAYRQLQGTEFTRPTSFRVVRGDDLSGLNGAAPLEYEPESVQGSGYRTFATAQALLNPHRCLELYGGPGIDRIMGAQDRVRPWLEGVLEGRTPGFPVPADVASSFTVIEDCQVQTGKR